MVPEVNLGEEAPPGHHPDPRGAQDARQTRDAPPTAKALGFWSWGMPPCHHPRPPTSRQMTADGGKQKDLWNLGENV